MKTVTESIFDNGRVVIPLARVSHIQRYGREVQYACVIMDCTTWCVETHDYNNAVQLEPQEYESFLTAWCRYRSELEAETLICLEPEGKQS